MTAEVGRLLGAGEEAEVFEFGDGVIKLYRRAEAKRSAFREAANLAVVESLGLPAPVVSGVRLVGERWGIAMSRAPGRPWAETMLGDPAALPAMLGAMAALHARVHVQPGAQLGGLKANLAQNIARADALGASRRQRLLEGLARMPDGDRVCHGDFHPWNIVGPPEQPLIVDWLDARCGDPAADICRSLVLIRQAAPDIAEAYVDACIAVAGINREAVSAWQPFIAGARCAENVPDEVPRLLGMVDSALL